MRFLKLHPDNSIQKQFRFEFPAPRKNRWQYKEIAGIPYYEIYYLNFASHKFAADARREGCRCISILQTVRNEADTAKSCDLFFANKSSFRAICN